MIDQVMAHGSSSNSEKMSAVLPLRFLLPNQSEIRFMDERCGLQCMAGALAAEAAARQTVQFSIDQRH